MAEANMDQNAPPGIGQSVPCLPPNLCPSHRNAWLMAVEFEITYFDINPSPLKPLHLGMTVMGERASRLLPFCGVRVLAEVFEWIAAKTDRLLFSGMATDDPQRDMSALVSRVVSEEFVVQTMLDAFAQRPPVTASKWYAWMISCVPPGLRPRVPYLLINYVFQMIALYGVCAHIKPSRLAAAMLSAVMGDHEAQHYTCGYTPAQLRVLRGYITHLLTGYCPGWQRRAGLARMRSAG